MIGALFRIARPAIYRLDPETAHNLALKVLAHLPTAQPAPSDARLRRRLLGINFANPVGLAAGFDKNGVATDGLLSLGFGFVELGTVTPRPQGGNPRPRLFRLDQSEGIINRLGFNNDGGEALALRLQARHGRAGIVGVNVGANRDSPDRIADYAGLVRRFSGAADYLTINVSSPNTPGLRNLQQAEPLGELIDAAKAARGASTTPILVKLAPDLERAALESIALVLTAKRVDGAIISNTTLSRAGVDGLRYANEQGGLSGRPLFRLATVQLARLRKLVGLNFPLIGVGGIDSAETALAKLTAGADLVQIYSGMIFKGPGLARDILTGLSARLDALGARSISEIVGSETDRWAATEI